MGRILRPLVFTTGGRPCPITIIPPTALGADARAIDAARILRPPCTVNHKYDPSRPVELERFEPRRRALEDVVGGLPCGTSATSRAGRRPLGAAAGDPLLQIEPAAYVRILLGVEVPRNRKITCPFHADRTPSLHVYGAPEKGWHCFGCGRGSSIYDMAAGIWGLGTRGGDFLELRERLSLRFLAGTSQR